jgi:hypothetical protein
VDDLAERLEEQEGEADAGREGAQLGEVRHQTSPKAIDRGEHEDRQDCQVE